MDCESLLNWFSLYKRTLPWRSHERSPYEVWISEIMLQQTTVQAVIPYYQRWMKRFTNLQELANAPLEEVIKLWEGLGYYSRAKNLHRGACYIQEHFYGIIPDEYDQLRKIPGVGSYTAGAILNFAFKKPTPAIDGNVSRVLSRFFAINEQIPSRKAEKRFIEELEKLLPSSPEGLLSEALIELGALICKKSPLCGICPVAHGCLAYKRNQVEQFPIKKKATPIQKKTALVFILEAENHYLILQHPEGKLLAHLHEFPLINVEKKSHS